MIDLDGKWPHRTRLNGQTVQLTKPSKLIELSKDLP
jgi:hypothetical protein